MKRTSTTIVMLALIALVVLFERGQLPGLVQAPSTSGTLARAYAQRWEDVQVQGEGRVVRVLTDDNDGSRHQRFILDVGGGQTVLVVHNIDLAPRIDALRSGDRVAFYGEYVWNERGGIIHWTHHDPAGRHVDGWLEHEGRRYQ
ncbi:DUF3465 domain-containing protein [Wenzhouxiangella marina]|uniref:Uncharacterized protein n=1 Tax=Wenzhouxiangella marina TaxID=1579979 RepID=A0A0K0Y0F8_9GAMM|nr:DUF3465 domain-containing protein [Wenzhouxiangella marina]AKS43372.1 hypothetical protein WM2015_3020 [Wenzhouxiangella marina]MBB6088512.1 hypothetical protein [Wenzhouxiangella marina]